MALALAPHPHSRNLRLAIRISRRRRVPDHTATSVDGVSRKVEDETTVLLKHLSRENLGEQVSWVGFTWGILDAHDTSAAKLAHLEQLPVDVA